MCSNRKTGFLGLGISGFLSLAAFLSLPAREAAAAGVFRPPCENEHKLVDSRKEELDKCIEKFESENKEEKRAAVASLPEKDLPCVAGFRSLLAAEEEFNKCMESQLWWKPKKK